LIPFSGVILVPGINLYFLTYNICRNMKSIINTDVAAKKIDLGGG